MSFRRLLPFFTALTLTVAAFSPLSARADSFSAIAVYGDSLSDNGNLYRLTFGLQPPSPPYDGGRYSNGSLAVEQLATRLGVPLSDFAVAGATSGVGNYGDGGTQTSSGLFNLPGMFTELASNPSKAFLASPIVSSSLFIVWGGANDFLANGSPLVAAQDIDTIVSKLQMAGATHILVPGTPDLGLTPDFLGTANQSLATGYSLAFNADLQRTLPAGATYVDTFGLLHKVVADPSAYGFTNVTSPCLTPTSATVPVTSDPSTYTVCSDPGSYLFWDGFHPTTAADAFVADEFLAAALPTPEPSTFVLLGSGALGLFLVVRRQGA